MCRERYHVITFSLIAVLNRTDKSLSQSTPSVAFIDDQISDVDFVIICPSCDGSNNSPFTVFGDKAEFVVVENHIVLFAILHESVMDKITDRFIHFTNPFDL